MGIFGFGSKETLFFPGCFSEAFLRNKIENYEKILKKLRIPFWRASNITCCGGILDESGYEKQLRKLAKENSEFLEKKEVKKIITICSKCQSTFKKYNEQIPNWEIKPEFIIQTILEALNQNKDLIKNVIREEIYYYDSCTLSRTLKIMEEPRELLKLLGYKVLELPNNKEDTLCCGSCGALSITNPEISDKISIDFFKILKRRNITRLVTADLVDYRFLKDCKQRFQLNDIEILEFSDLICEALGIKISEEEES